MHPTDASMPDDISFAAVTLEFTFKGSPAHAAAFPWKGANALSGVQLMFHAVDMMRLHFKDFSLSLIHISLRCFLKYFLSKALDTRIYALIIPVSQR